jgi:hypothetical protein
LGVKGPWGLGLVELLVLAKQLAAQGGDAHRRAALLLTHNATEMALGTYLRLPVSLRGGEPLPPEPIAGFAALLRKMLDQFPNGRVGRVSLRDFLEWNRLRNKLVHDGSGITPDRSQVDSFLVAAADLVEALFGAEFSSAEVSLAPLPPPGPTARTERDRHRWTRDDEIATACAYLARGSVNLPPHEKDELAQLIGTTVASVALKLLNLDDFLAKHQAEAGSKLMREVATELSALDAAPRRDRCREARDRLARRRPAES